MFKKSFFFFKSFKKAWENTLELDRPKVTKRCGACAAFLIIKARIQTHTFNTSCFFTGTVVTWTPHTLLRTAHGLFFKYHTRNMNSIKYRWNFVSSSWEVYKARKYVVFKLILWSHLRRKLTLTLLTWRTWWAPNNVSKWQMGFNSAFKGLK